MERVVVDTKVQLYVVCKKPVSCRKAQAGPKQWVGERQVQLTLRTAELENCVISDPGSQNRRNPRGQPGHYLPINGLILHRYVASLDVWAPDSKVSKSTREN